jgi:hypothetical protein
MFGNPARLSPVGPREEDDTQASRLKRGLGHRSQEGIERALRVVELRVTEVFGDKNTGEPKDGRFCM